MSRAEGDGFGIAKGAFLGMGRLALNLYSMTRVGMEHGWMDGHSPGDSKSKSRSSSAVAAIQSTSSIVTTFLA